ncbi:PDZ domain-containing protein [Bacillus pumilus]|uniref:PDZ domain-containing protein n=1 Tax=Bacillus TaxID=1386 RepID=UPI0007764E26|nr:PDZ domain-containing protein [Bacillus pumilus]AMM98844.1 cell division protein [Bacillus pumilus]MDH3149289.1 PDZ domain-containing protein [Bacillus pumilus]QLI76728.1 PDZ domain-containing protein [Bacillus pumilus]
MSSEWMGAGLKAVGLFLIHPLFYFMILISLLHGYIRVKRERKAFQTRIEDVYDELKFTYSKGWILGICLSIISVGLGIALPPGFIVLIAAMTIVCSLFFKASALSSAYTLGFSFIAALGLLYVQVSHSWLPQLSMMNASAVVILLGLLLMTEGILAYRTAHLRTSPAMVMSARGLLIGQQRANRLWLLPLVLLMPAGEFTSSLPWWPVLQVHDQSFSFILIPYIIGFGQRIQGSLPIVSIQITARRILMLGLAVALLGAASIWFEPIAWGAVLIAIAGRAFLSWKQRVNDNAAPFYFSKRNQGLMVLGIIPNTPAADLKLEIGEVITKVNGIEVKTVSEFYEALQTNRALAKLEIIGLNGQTRFEKRASYEGEHHQLGILFVKDDPQQESTAISS